MPGQFRLQGPTNGARRRSMPGKMRTCFIVLTTLALAAAWAGESPGAQGIPVTSELVIGKCTGCHKNNGGIVSRISFLRQVPEAWEETLWRHKRIHGLSITREEKEALLIYFSERQGLAPDEVLPYAYTLEKRDTKEKVDNQVIVDVCVRCHSYAKTALQRRTTEEWTKLANMHSGVLPMWPYQLQDVLDWDDTLAACLSELSKRFPLDTPEWKQWSGSRPKAGEGKWIVAGYQAGKGAYAGEIALKKTGDPFYSYTGTVEFENGEKQPIEGKATLYGGYAWRASGTLAGKPIREVFHISMDGSTFTGVRFDDPHFELRGVETRAFAGGPPRILSVMPKALSAGKKDAAVTIVGAGLSKEVNLGDGVIVKKVVSATPEKVVLSVDVDAKAAAGYRDAKAGAAAASRLFAVYTAVDYIKVVPSPAMSRTGGLGHAVKQLVQFDAMAYANGADGAAGTGDDIEIGRVPAAWRVVELASSNEDQDAEFVGAIDRNGLFTPGDEGPNPKRFMQENNMGDVWVTASYDAPGGRTLAARGYLLATIPLYIQRPVQ
jgi:quinohemoprotein amine dehydrogenase